MANPLLIKILQGAGATIIERPLSIIDRQLAASNERKSKELEQKLRHEDEKFMQDLELENRRLNAEIDDQIAARELDRQKKIMDAIESYQKSMADCSISIGESLGIMSIELRDRAMKLVEERRRDYEETQNRASERAMSQLETISQKFPEGSKAREIMEDSVGKQLSNIIDTATHFMQTIDEDFRNLLANVDQITRNSIENSNQYIAPASRKLFLNDGK